jgi:hypothetical protein
MAAASIAAVTAPQTGYASMIFMAAELTMWGYRPER